MFFDISSNQKEFGASILLVSLERAHTLISIKLDFDVTNNITEYEACIIELQAAVGIVVNNIRVYKNFNLIINQIP